MIHLIVGNTGAGKTSYAHQLQEESKGIVFSIDQWNKILFFPDKREKDGLSWFLERIERAETLMMHQIIQLDKIGVDAILDLGLAKQAHRAKFIKFAKENSLQWQIHYLNLSKEIRYQRIQKRNNEKGETFEFEVTQANFDFMESWFEKPSEQELENAIIIDI